MAQQGQEMIPVVAIFCIVHGAILCHGGWIDPDTPEEYLTVSSNFAEDTREYELVNIDIDILKRSSLQEFNSCLFAVATSTYAGLLGRI